MSSESELSDSNLAALRDIMKQPKKKSKSRDGDRPKRVIKPTTKVLETTENFDLCAPSKIYL